jgi:hypothetical protein
MDRGRKAEPRGNKLLHAAELLARQAAHERMLRNAKPSVDFRAPKGFGAVRRNPKKEQQLEDRYAHIEHENRLLLARMSDIMTRPTGGGALPGAGGVDNVCTAWEYGRSLNRRTRQRELERINEDNQVRRRGSGGACGASIALLPRALPPFPSPPSPHPLLP